MTEQPSAEALAKLGSRSALNHLKALRALLPAPQPSILIYRRRRDRKIVHLAMLAGGDTDTPTTQVYTWQRFMGGSGIRLRDVEAWRAREGWRRRKKWSVETYPLSASVSEELAAITRRAFVPTVAMQLYH